MKHSALLRAALNMMSLLRTAVPLVCPVRTTTVGTDANKSRRLDEIFIATSNSINESFRLTDEIQRLLTNISPGDYKNSIDHITKVFQKRPRTPVDEAYKIAEYKGLHKLLSLVLERGFFRREYEEEDLTKHTAGSLSWAKHVILQKKLVDSLHHKDLFSHLYYQIFDDMKALGADENIFSWLSTTLNSMLEALNSISLAWLKYIGEDNDQMANNVEYLRLDDDTRKKMDLIWSPDLLKILNSDGIIDIYDITYSNWRSTIDPEIRKLFIMIHALTYVKMYEPGNEANSDIIDRYARLYSNMRVFYLFTGFIFNLDRIIQDKGCQITDYITVLSDILIISEFRRQIGQLIIQTSGNVPCNEIYVELESKLEPFPGQNFPIISAMQILSTSLLSSIFKVEDTGMADIHKLVGVEKIDCGLIVPGSPNLGSGLIVPGSPNLGSGLIVPGPSNLGSGLKTVTLQGSAANDIPQLPTETSNNDLKPPRSRSSVLVNIGVVVSLALIVLVALLFLLRLRAKADEGKI